MKALVKKSLSIFGYELRKKSYLGYDYNIQKTEYNRKSSEIYNLKNLQKIETVKDLKTKHEAPILGKVSVLEALKLLSQCVDPTDNILYLTSQLIHTLQVIEGMEKDGICDSDMLIAALVHDLGKILLLFGEQPENIVCVNRVVDQDSEAIGFDNHIFQYGHDEFAYSRLKNYLPDHISWLIRYHSIRLHECDIFMDAKDKEFAEKYLIPFKKYDQGTKSIYVLPEKKIDDYSDLINQYFPGSIII
jgi:hypothetical protein